MSFESPISVLQNLAGEEVAIVSGSALNNGEQPGVAVLAKDEAGNAQFLNMNAAGELKVQATVDVDLDYTSDSVKVYGGNDVALVQDAGDNYLLVRDQDAADAIGAASTAITGSIASMDSNLGGKLDTLDGSVDAVATAVGTMDSNLGGKLDTLDGSVDAVATAVGTMDSNLGGKLDTLDGSVGAVESAVGAAEAGIVSALTGSVAGAISTMDSNLGGKLDTLDGSVGAVESAVSSASTAITGAIASFESSFNSRDLASETTLDAFKTAFETEDFASEATLDAFKTANHSDLEAVSGSVAALGADLNAQLDQFTFNASGSLKVEADVNVTLAYGDDSVTVYGSQGQALVQDAGDNYLLVRDQDAADAMDAAKAAITGSIAAFQADFNEFVPGLSGAIAEGNAYLGTIAAVDFATEATLLSIDGKDFATEATLDAFKTANHLDLMAVSGAINAYRTDFAEFVPGLSGAIAEGNVSLGTIAAVDFATEATLLSIDGKDFATETTLDALKTANHVDLMEVSGALEAFRANFNEFVPGLSAVLTDISSSSEAGNALLDQFTFNASGSLKVEADVNVTLDHGDDSVTSYQGGTWDVSVNNFPAVQAVSQDGAPWSVEATDLDIRDLSYTQDSVKIYGDEGLPFAQIAGSGEMIAMVIGSEGEALKTDATGHLDIVATDLDIRNLDHASDSVEVYQGTSPWVVSATALDIRALTSADVVTVDGFSTFASANHTDLEAVGTAVGAAEAGIVAALTGSVEEAIGAVESAVGAAEAGIVAALTGSVHADLDAIATAVGAIDAAQLGTVTVTGTDLDIRDLSYTQDSVTARANGTSASVSEAGASTSSAEVLAANSDRMSAMFFMDGNATCYIKLGSSASNSSFSVRLINNGYYELPEGYQGAVHAAFSVTDGGIKLRITELAYV